MQDTCPSEHKNDHIYVRVLHEACTQLGGEHKLAQYLGVELRLVEAWLEARARPPDQVFLRCLDLIGAGKA